MSPNPVKAVGALTDTRLASNFLAPLAVATRRTWHSPRLTRQPGVRARAPRPSHGSCASWSSASAIRTRGMVASGKHEVFSDPVAGQRMN